MSAENKALVEKHIDLSWNKGKFGLLNQIVGKGFRYQTTFKDGYRDFDGYVEYVEDIRGAVEDLEVIIEEITEFGEYVPGEFYKRELPCIIAIMEKVEDKETTSLYIPFFFL